MASWKCRRLRLPAHERVNVEYEKDLKLRKVMRYDAVNERAYDHRSVATENSR